MKRGKILRDVERWGEVGLRAAGETRMLIFEVFHDTKTLYNNDF